MIEELADLRQLLKSRRGLKRKHREPDSASEAQEPDGDDGDNGDDGNDGNDENDHGSTTYNSKSPWIGVMIKAPAGERGRGTNTEGRLGFKIEDILKHARITTEQWSQFMVSTIRFFLRNPSIDRL